MKIRLNVSTDYDGNEIHDLFINDKEDLSIRSLSECPEDAIIGRDLIDGNQIIDYIQMGYDAAKRGEELEIEETTNEEEDDD